MWEPWFNKQYCTNMLNAYNNMNNPALAHPEEASLSAPNVESAVAPEEISDKDNKGKWVTEPGG